MWSCSMPKCKFTVAKFRNPCTVLITSSRMVYSLGEQGHSATARLTHFSRGYPQNEVHDQRRYSYYWVTQWAGANLTNDGRNLASTIAHEMDHHLANTSYPTLTDLNGHLKVNGSIRPEHTLNSQACAV